METFTAPWPVWAFLSVVVMVTMWWFYLVIQFFSYISTNHPNLYEEMGSPTLFEFKLENKPSGKNVSLLKFILSGKYKALNDSKLDSLCRFMKVFFYLYMANFVLLAVLIFKFGSA